MNLLKTFRDCIKAKGLNQTPERETIVRAFSRTKGHFSAKELHEKLAGKNPRIKFTTVYRTLKLMEECGLAETTFDKKTTKYEYKKPTEHHDHLICIKCGKIIEFENKTIEKEQEKTAAKYNFKITSHNLQLYGLCNNCAE